MLLSACEKGDLDTVKQVLSPSDIELKNSQGLTALSIASKAGYNNIVQCLLEAGANINTLNNARQSPLFLACWNNKEDVVKSLLSHKPDINASDQRGWTPLIIAVYQNHEKIVSLLLDYGCNIEKKDTFGKQAIDRAKTPHMIEMLKNAISKTRKTKINSPARSARSGSPAISPKTETSLKIPRSSSADRRIPLPQSLSRTSSEKSLSIDYRKLTKDKVDKKIKEKFENFEDIVHKKWNILLKNCLSDQIESKKAQLTSKLKGVLDSKTKDFYPRLKDFYNKAIDAVKQTKSANIISSPHKTLEIQDLIHDTLSKSQYKATNNVEKSIEVNVSKNLDNAIQIIKQSLMSELQSDFSEAFKELKSKLIDSQKENTVKNPFNMVSPEPSQRLLDISKSFGIEKFSTGVKPGSKINPGSTLQEFLKYEKMAKASK